VVGMDVKKDYSENEDQSFKGFILVDLNNRADYFDNK